MREPEDNLPAYCRNDYVENFVVSKEFLTKDECEKITKDALKLGLYDAEVQVKKGPVTTSDLKEEIRDSKIHFINYDNRDFDWFFERLIQKLVNVNEDYFKFDIVGFLEDLQFTEYNAPAGHYSEHTDKLLQGNVRKLTMVMQLTDPSEYEGGELELCLGGEPFVVPKEQGTLVTFPSYVLHRVRPTTKGTRHSLVGWVTGRPFK